MQSSSSTLELLGLVVIQIASTYDNKWFTLVEFGYGALETEDTILMDV